MLVKNITRKFLCLIGDHEWTSAALEGHKPTQSQLNAGLLGFKEYAIMYCKHCKKISRLSC